MAEKKGGGSMPKQTGTTQKGQAAPGASTKAATPNKGFEPKGKK